MTQNTKVTGRQQATKKKKKKKTNEKEKTDRTIYQNLFLAGDLVIILLA